MTAKIKLNAASGGGSISIQAPSSSSNNRVIALPDIADGTLVTSESTLDATKLSGNLPALNGSALTNVSAGKLLQIKQIVKTDVVSYSVNAGSFATTDSSFSISITPSSTSSLILLGGFMNLAVSGSVSNVSIVYRRDGSTISTAVNGSGTDTPIGDGSGNRKRVTSSGVNTDPAGNCFTFSLLDKPATTSSVTYSFGVGHGSSSTRTMYIGEVNGDTNSSSLQRNANVIIAQEIAG